MNAPTTFCILLAIIVINSSCSHCEDDGAADNIAIQYRINVDEPIIAQVQYRNANGEIISENMAGQALTSWHRIEYVDDPFQAYKKVQFLNISNGEVKYTLRLFVDGNLIHKKEGSISPESEGSDEIRYALD
jgi:hypothetical protein